jgi:hypothetical protein
VQPFSEGQQQAKGVYSVQKCQLKLQRNVLMQPHYARFCWSTCTVSAVIQSTEEKVGPVSAMKAYVQRGGIAPLILNLSTRWK